MRGLTEAEGKRREASERSGKGSGGRHAEGLEWEAAEGMRKGLEGEAAEGLRVGRDGDPMDWTESEEVEWTTWICLSI